MSSRRFRGDGFRWQGVDVRPYREEAEGRFRGVTRQTLIDDADAGLGCEARYFEIEPGGHSSCESHRHAHFVLVLRGEGTVRLDDEELSLAPFDAVYVAPGSVHQFRAGATPLGFLCVVDRDRDRPRPCDETAEPTTDPPS